MKLLVSHHPQPVKGPPLLMLTREDDVDAHALHRRAGRSPRSLGISVMTANHPRLSARRRVGGQRRRSEPDRFGVFARYCRERLVDDPHLSATTLFDDVLELGYDRSYPTFTRQLRARGRRPLCEPCRPVKGRPVAVIGVHLLPGGPVLRADFGRLLHGRHPLRTAQ